MFILIDIYFDCSITKSKLLHVFFSNFLPRDVNFKCITHFKTKSMTCFFCGIPSFKLKRNLFFSVVRFLFVLIWQISIISQMSVSYKKSDLVPEKSKVLWKYTFWENKDILEGTDESIEIIKCFFIAFYCSQYYLRCMFLISSITALSIVLLLPQLWTVCGHQGLASLFSVSLVAAGILFLTFQKIIAWNPLRKKTLSPFLRESPDAPIQRCSQEKVFWKYAVNLQENTNAEVWLW